MNEQFSKIECYLMAAKPEQAARHFEKEGEFTRLEKGYKRYATLFETVRLILHDRQEKGHYLNYPYVCDNDADLSTANSVAMALADSQSEAVFVGSSDIDQFPFELAIDLVRKYDGESFLGYYRETDNTSEGQPLFGIYHKRIAEKLGKLDSSNEAALDQFLADEGRLLPLPESYSADLIGMK